MGGGGTPIGRFTPGITDKEGTEYQSGLNRSIVDVASTSCGQDGQDELPNEYVATTESHLERGDYLGDGPFSFREQLTSRRSLTMLSGLSEVDYQILELQKAFDLPQRSVRASLIDGFFTFCSQWTPIVDRSWLDEGRVDNLSLLLLNAVFLAGSRVSSTRLRAIPSEEFYRRARLLFILGHEKDVLTSIVALCLLNWWNPTGPEQISTSTSGFWVRAATSLAHQIGLHKEPQEGPQKMLRRRLWWTLVCRDNIISVGVGRPRALNLKDSDVAPLTVQDFPLHDAHAHLFVAFCSITRLLGDVTECIRRKTLSSTRLKDFENAVYRWIKELPDGFRLFLKSPRKLGPYNFEARQLLVPYFVLLIIMSKHSPTKDSAPSVPLVASSFVAGIYEDFLNRDEIRYLGPAFTFYALAAGLAHLSGYRYRSLKLETEESLDIILNSLTELKQRWGSAESISKALAEVKNLTLQSSSLGYTPGSIPQGFVAFFDDFGPEICRMWNLVGQEVGLSNQTGSLHNDWDLLSPQTRSNHLAPRNSHAITESRPDGVLPTTLSRPDTVEPLGNQTTNIESINEIFNEQNGYFRSEMEPFRDWILEELGAGTEIY
ncbi:uncharacterized protein Z518_05612 [Rhinocladiella mackenziei CBS 650.93]|uniref:Rhinocladiella mackenziei CBS 650.93 unplaced genomic scaffold supercont1.4, whole genome shotgun sequence n=1 Tax=Rhinocladiella mackenziei CBS 650.93 TaxID=1442369 RepID=A0A0D2FRB4_9EURO|nr:uncharacterized protein Z518_05612 [Rhinocladiella mackenziei CBS 650.93]KIX04742.1 hypothetical protein Z518_05612 [Rhinocladiella mackenziei CBS 650.93]